MLRFLKKYPRKLVREQILILTASLLLSAAAFYISLHSGSLAAGKKLSRGSYGTHAGSYPLLISGLLPDGPVPVRVQVDAMRYTRQEAEKVFLEIQKKTESLIPAKEDSLGAVTHDLHLPSHLAEYGVDLKWDYYPESDSGSADTDAEYYRTYRNLVDTDGIVRNEDLPEGSVITGYLSLVMGVDLAPEENGIRGDPSASSAGTRAAGKQAAGNQAADSRYYSAPFRIYLNILPRTYTPEEKLRKQLEDALVRANLSGLSSPFLTLPDEVDGHRLSYAEKPDQRYLLFPLLGIIAAAALYLREGTRLKEEKKRRENQLLLDYSELVSKLMVYIGAGLTVRNAFEAIGAHYDRLVENRDSPDRPLYQELRTMRRQFERNMPEADIYIQLSKRVHLKPYTKLCSLIEQNRKNGSKNLRSLLRMEMEEAFETRKSTALRLGEEAGTKLLLPLFLLLLIVMIIVIVPAMMAIR